MVHALQEIHRVLVDDGILLDLRPSTVVHRIEVLIGDVVLRAGHVDIMKTLPDKMAADKAIEEVVQAQWFFEERVAHFDFSIYFDDMDDLYAYQQSLGRSFIPQKTIETTQRLIDENSGEAKIRNRFQLQIGQYRKG